MAFDGALEFMTPYLSDGVLHVLQFVVERVLPEMNKGLGKTVALILPSAVLGFFLGVVVGATRVFAPRPLVFIANGYVSLFRGVPLLLQLYFLYYALPAWGIRFEPYEAAVLGFILCSGAYHSEYIRGALLSIRPGQIKAALALGFTRFQMVKKILVPQAMRLALPGCGNEIIYLIKYSSLAYVLTYIELTGHAKELANRTFTYIEVYLTAGLYYLILTTLAAWFLRWLEKKVAVPGFGIKHS